MFRLNSRPTFLVRRFGDRQRLACESPGESLPGRRADRTGGKVAERSLAKKAAFASPSFCSFCIERGKNCNAGKDEEIGKEIACGENACCFIPCLLAESLLGMSCLSPGVVLLF